MMTIYCHYLYIGHIDTNILSLLIYCKRYRYIVIVDNISSLMTIYWQ